MSSRDIIATDVAVGGQSPLFPSRLLLGKGVCDMSNKLFKHVPFCEYGDKFHREKKNVLSNKPVYITEYSLIS